MRDQSLDPNVRLDLINQKFATLQISNATSPKARAVFTRNMWLGFRGLNVLDGPADPSMSSAQSANLIAAQRPAAGSRQKRNGLLGKIGFRSSKAK